MIKYALICECDYEFESWFRSSDTYDEQVKSGLVECPRCQSTHVQKALMAPAVSTSKRQERVQASQAIESAAQDTNTQDAAAPDNSAPVAILDPQQVEIREMIRTVHKKLTENATDVGENFSNEARKMHDGDTEKRSIYGRASLDEIKSLAEDGIAVMPLPTLPDDQN